MDRMSEEEMLVWGAAEDAARKADIAAVKAGAMGLEEAQRLARHRARHSGMTPSEAYRALCNAQRKARQS